MSNTTGLAENVPHVADPANNGWAKCDADFHPIDIDILGAITTPLTRQDIEADDAWLEESTILVTSNVDRTVLNACMANVLQ
ncbi:hypothetical protein PC129_g19901 [Phytophthora cactorum]|uniref:Uncharacterized protein n=1 Tax=Phytophthora cactorum TaxID=29920 RepID=A0A329RIB2_9STRA|nr:hypothetical protein Pcac1_g22606 [Phytophthora cactorum]KAG2926028.1 hypothetical protein PC114_g3954 [Phytophthora cactorum]KAG2939414.1 hypothetical protein PC115_g3135 [Phytophthora cactorum]KAG2950412.1 hypothetical protein PC117_g4452 [Phytophthora cactorum]KAG3038870.1 hypothetical protein PC119_g2601 [Phytophthora cactorum]